MNKTVLIIQTGVANVASVIALFDRLGKKARLTTSPREIAEADCAVLPGVGSFHSGMKALSESGLSETIRRRISDNQPTLAICLGLQLLANSSEESPETSGLGVFSGDIKRFSSELRVPQLGWNEVLPARVSATENEQATMTPALIGPGLIRPGYAYFANSYRLTTEPSGWVASWSDYAGPFVAALERGNILACQFHPELSGQWGSDLIRRWLEHSSRASSSTSSQQE